MYVKISDRFNYQSIHEKYCNSIINSIALYRSSSTKIKVASVEFNPQFMQLDSNITGIVNAIIPAKNGAKLIVLPEASNYRLYLQR